MAKRTSLREPQLRRLSDEFGIVFVNFRRQEQTRSRKKEELTHGDMLKALTINLVNTYTECSSEFRYSNSTAPRRVLTKLSKGVHNGGYDNANHDYICRVGDKIMNPDGQTYEIAERLGQGTFGQVLKCGLADGGAVALKIIKNKPAYYHQALLEVHILQTLNSKYDPEDQKRIVRMVDFFVYRKHLCIAFELLSVNMYDVLKQNSFRGVSMTLIRVLTEQLLKAMQCLREARVIHCDLKPENVLLSNMQHTHIKLIDFGSACFENHTVYPYIQSRFYRSPEVLLGLPYTGAIDMWSLGCICAELFLGLPIFPGHSEYDQVCRIVEVLGVPPIWMLESGKHRSKFFKRMEEIQSEVKGQLESPEADLASGSASNTECSQDASAEGLQHLEAEEATADQSKRAENCDMQEDQCKRQLREDDDPMQASGAPAPSVLDNSGNRSRLMTQETEPPQPISATAVDEVPAVPPPQEPPTTEPTTTEPTTTEPMTTEPEIPAAADVPRSESLLDLLKRKVFNVAEPPPSQAAPPAAASTDIAADSTPSTFGHCAGGATASDSGQSAPGSATLSTATPLEYAPDSTTRDSSDGRGATSPDGGFRSSQQGFGRRPGRNRRRRTRTPQTKRTVWRLKTREEYERDDAGHKKEPIPKKYCNFKSLEQMVELVPFRGLGGTRKPLNESQERKIMEEEKDRRACFLQFLTGVLNISVEERWTPKQANSHSFISGEPYEANWAPPWDEPYNATLRQDLPRRGLKSTGGADQVPRLPTEGLGQYTGGGSARTWQDVCTLGQSGNMEHQPKSAPATTRGNMNSARGGQLTHRGIADVDNEKSHAKNALSGEPCKKSPPSEPAVCGLWGQVCAGIPLPDDNPAESYRPNIEKLSEDFLRGLAPSHPADVRSGNLRGLSEAYSTDNFSTTRGGSTGNSMYSSASSTGSTPTGQAGGRGRRNSNGSPNAGISSPLSAGYPHRTRGMHHSFSQEQTRGMTGSRHTSSGTLGNATSSPAQSHGGNAASSPAQSHGEPTAGAPATARTTASNAGGSRDGSRGSSPWRLPSPMSEISTASDRVNSSQPSGSDSCGEPLPHDGGLAYRFYEGPFSGEDASHSDNQHYHRPHQLSDSDGTNTPRSHDNVATHRPEEERGGATKDSVSQNIKSELARVQLSRDRLPRSMHVTQSPGGGGSNFREAVGMNESGPVTPFARHNASAVAGTGGNPAGRPFSPQPRNTGSSDGGNHQVGFTHPSQSSLLSGLGGNAGSTPNQRPRRR